MSSLTSLFKKEHMGQLILAILFVIYLIMGYNTPAPVADLIDTVVGKVVVIVIALALFANSNVIVGILGLLDCFVLHYSCKSSTRWRLLLKLRLLYTASTFIFHR